MEMSLMKMTPDEDFTNEDQSEGSNIEEEHTQDI